MVTGEVASVYGSASIISYTAPNKLSLTLPVQVAGVTVLENEGEYSIWDTDYDNYAVVYVSFLLSSPLMPLQLSLIISLFVPLVMQTNRSKLDQGRDCMVLVKTKDNE